MILKFEHTPPLYMAGLDLFMRLKLLNARKANPSYSDLERALECKPEDALALFHKLARQPKPELM